MDGARGAPRYAALVLAGRRGADDPLARSRGASHRALVPVAGVPMLVRVLGALRDAARVGPVWVSIDSPELLEREPALAAASYSLHRSLSSPARSVADALARLPAGPVLVTTADHALLTGARVDGFLDAADASGADLAVGAVERGAFADPAARAARTWIRLRDGAWSGANLFAFRTPRGRSALDLYARAESHRKRPWKLLAALAPGLGLAYLAGRLDVDGVFERVSRRVGARLRPVRLADAEAAIDVDKASDLALAEAILARRQPTASDAPCSGPRAAKR